MAANTDALLNLIALVGSGCQVQRTVKGSAVGSLYAAAGAFGGGLLMGPVGLVVGSTLGGLAGYATKKGSFLSIKDALDSMAYDQKERIAKEFYEFIKKLDVNDVVTLTIMCTNVLARSGPGGLAVHPILAVIRKRAVDAVRRQFEQRM